MSTPILERAFTTGEVAPALFGNVQLARMHAAASTMRNFFVGYQGGAYSRAGTAFVGFSKQTGRAYPPRVISFQFSINQGLALEFGNFYMRVIFDGAYVTEAPYVITNATQASPCVLTISPTSTLDSVTPINSAVSASYVPGDTVSLAGGTFSTRAVARVAYTQLSSIAVNAPGSNYAAGGLITLNGGSPIVRPVVRIATAKVVSVAAIENAGSGGTPGAAVLTGTTGTGTKVQLNVTIGGLGQLVSINSIAVAGSYSVDPYTAIYGFETDQLSGGGFAAPPYVLYRMGVDTVSVVDPGQFFANGATFTQYSTNGSGSGATFNTPVFGVYSATVLTPGEYTVLPTNPVAQFGTSGTGVGVTFTAAWSSSPSIATGDWFFVQGVGGMTEINNQTFVASVAGANLSLFDVYGNPIDSTLFTAYTSGGTASRIYTLATQFSEQDLDWIKATESADTMSLCCVNQQTGTEYPPVDLTRFADDNWVLTTVVATPSLSAPTGASVTVTPQPATPVADAGYSYVVTALNSDGTESIASNIASVADQTDIGATAGTATIAWSDVIGGNKYFVYKATPVLVPHGTGSHVPPTGSPFGYVGYAFGSRFMDTNIIPDFTQVPPLHKNPFARGQILSLTPGAGGSGYTSTPTATINTFTGGGAVILPVVDAANTVVSYIVQDGGQNYAPTDTVTISGGGGSGATATLVLGPQTGTYPGVVAYFQQRRTYAYTINQPDTYFMSQPGLFLNFDTRDPTIPSDAITGTPWSVQVNGIQFMVPIGGALMVLTGLEAYLLTGEGGSTFTPQPLTPSSQSAQNQGFNGCSATVPPVRIYQDVLYVQAKGSTYRDFSFDVSKYSYTGDDITQAATQLFTGYTIKQHAWCEEPYRVLWAVRSDGVLLSLTWMKTEKVCGWARHDTFGSVKSLCSVTEPPVDALYLAVQRNIGEHTAYTIERMNNRIWNSVEDAWCVDCGFSLPMDKPEIGRAH